MAFSEPRVGFTRPRPNPASGRLRRCRLAMDFNASEARLAVRAVAGGEPHLLVAGLVVYGREFSDRAAAALNSLRRYRDGRAKRARSR